MLLIPHATRSPGWNLGMCEREDMKKGLVPWGGSWFWPVDTRQNQIWEVITYPNSLETPGSDFNGDAMPVALHGNSLRGSRCWWHLMALELRDGTMRVPVALGLSVVLGGTSIVVEILELCISMGSNQLWLVQTSCEWFKLDKSASSGIKQACYF